MFPVAINMLSRCYYSSAIFCCSISILAEVTELLPVAIVFAAILADVTASSAISPVAIVPSSIWSVVI